MTDTETRGPTGAATRDDSSRVRSAAHGAAEQASALAGTGRDEAARVADEVALGIGWIVGSAAPKTERERAMARRVEPALAGAAQGVVHQGQEVVEEMREPVRDAVDRVEHVGAEAAGDLRDEAKGAARAVRDQSHGS